ncbi:DUF2232 domain-containing protein [Desulfogranum mediterraneum]|uniref:DUF2232 domain-containing protein n=1 Tax=Desulfogranum mediterraneum TaxID=160661 RepID=UPI0004273280|nr:DUF2232 domain-containing protein [Desulfogranum mediterraneum]
MLVAALFFLPSFQPMLFGWMHGLLGIPVFLILCLQGSRAGTVLLRNSLLLAAGGLLLSGQLEQLLFSLTLVPLGYTLYRGISSEQSACESGARGLCTLSLSWFTFWTIYGIVTGVQPYNQLVAQLDASFAQTYLLYSEQADLDPESLFTLHQIIETSRSLLPKILPGILACITLATVWLNLICCNGLIRRMRPQEGGWRPYSSWSLPEQLVWLPIAAVLLILPGQEAIRNIGICLLLVGMLLYFFQGLAVFFHLLDRWNVPRYLRGMLYVTLVIQSYGLLIISLLGMSEVWLNIRSRVADKGDR